MPADPDTRPGDPPPNPAARLWWAVPGVGIVVLAVISMLFGGGPEKVDFGTSYDASATGSRAAYLILQELGYPVERSRRPSGGDVRWVLFPTSTGAKEAAVLNDWVRRGGVLLLAVDDADLPNHLGLPVTVTNACSPKIGVGRFGMTVPKPGEKGQARTAEAPDVASLLAGSTEVDGPPGNRTWGEVAGKPLITIYTRDRGEIWLLHHPDVFTNVNLRGEDNAVLVCRLAGDMLDDHPNGRLIFDEYCHGLRDRPTATELLFRPPVLGVTLQVVLLTGLVLWHFGVRFGPLRTVPPPPRRSKEEFLDAMAELLTRHGDRADAFRTVRDDFQRRLELDLGLPHGTPVDVIAREAARRRGVGSDLLLELLSAPGPPTGRGAAAFLTALHQLETTADDCFQSRKRTR
ncbi:DUF4350 domain-containing protein [Fimbriiglobus ruber]|uniref:DUF4350 domain-containing protein n=1 Tax=Fimbriiglobus ruber TaxID=1908690 RepID=A0A225DMK0_9BACT|nr:DUF4350 domain-containing protein [Fimbriiglobus ruber]OWK42243.1 hypothetical protein FRUB_04321 [Fimbriiglobus ruber]